MIDFQTLFQQILDKPFDSLLVIGNLVIIESLLSIDNAAALATLVIGLKEEDRGKALKYGILGAYIFRGLSLLFATLLLQFWFLKVLGGAYLIWLAVSHFRKKTKSEIDEEIEDLRENKSRLERMFSFMGVFWRTVIIIEIMDLAFSIDNVFAAVAFSKNILLVYIGVIIGILAMRFVAQWFVGLLGKYPFLEKSAFIIIFLLGLKLSASLIEHLLPEGNAFSEILNSHLFDGLFSLFSLSIIIVPILLSRFKKS